jgi:hypothetical protein
MLLLAACRHGVILAVRIPVGLTEVKVRCNAGPGSTKPLPQDEHEAVQRPLQYAADRPL